MFVEKAGYAVPVEPKKQIEFIPCVDDFLEFADSKYQYRVSVIERLIGAKQDRVVVHAVKEMEFSQEYINHRLLSGKIK